MHNAPRAPRVLLVNDSIDEREMYAEWLCRHGYSTVEATNAEEATRLALEDGVDVVVTDVKLSGSTDGFALTRRLRDAAATYGLTIVILTGYVSSADEQNADRAGCDLYLRKPCLPEELTAALEQLISHRV